MPTIQSAHLSIACHNAYVCTVIVRVFCIYHIFSDLTKRILALAKVRLAFGSFRVRSTNLLLNLRDPPPISMKFGTLADNA